MLRKVGILGSLGRRGAESVNQMQIRELTQLSVSMCKMPTFCNMGRGDEAQGNQFELLDFNLSLVVSLLFLPSSNYVDSSVFTDPL